MSAKLAVVVVLDTLSFAVTPGGTPDTDRATLRLLAPDGVATPIVLLTPGPLTSSVRLLAEEERLKLDEVTVTAMLAVLVTVSDVPLTLTV